MNIIPEIAALDADMRGWRHHLHAHPETAFEEHATAAFVADKLASFGIEVHRGLAGTGVVGTLRNGGRPRHRPARRPRRAPHPREDRRRPRVQPGKMHACGHDGHTTMLLGAAKALAQRKSFDGTVYFIFQPAEENEGGGRVMVEQGLFEQFPMRAVYGMHNWPRMPNGHVRDPLGPDDGRYDVFELVATGRGATPRCPTTASTRSSPRARSTRCRRSSAATFIRSIRRGQRHPVTAATRGT